jgi:serine/threonine-protein kinase
MRAAFDQAIALDSAFAPAYIHQIGLALEQGDMAGAQRYIERYLALEPRDHYADAIRLTRRLIDPAQARSPEVSAALDTASLRLLTAIMNSYPGWPDSLEVAVRLTRAINTAHPSAPGRAEANTDPLQLVNALAYHGRFAEAWQDARSLPGLGLPAELLADGAWSGALPADSVSGPIADNLRRDPLYHGSVALLAAPWWGLRRDTVSLREMARRGDALLRSSPSAGGQAFARYVVDAAHALTLLARGDTLGAIAGLQALPDTVCTRCVLYKVTLARLLDARRMDAQAAALLAEDSPGFVKAIDGFWALYRARLATRRGDRDEAIRQWNYVRAVWVNADSALQVYVREAAAALAREVDRD